MLTQSVVLVALALACIASVSAVPNSNLATYNTKFFQELRDARKRQLAKSPLLPRAFGQACYACHNVADCNDPFKTAGAIDCTGNNLDRPECDLEHDLGHTYLISFDLDSMGGSYKCTKVVGTDQGRRGTLRALVGNSDCNANNQFIDTTAMGLTAITQNVCCATERCNSATSLLVSYKSLLAVAFAAVLFMLSKQ